MAPADSRCVHLDDPADGRLLQPPALLRPRHDRGGGEGLSQHDVRAQKWQWQAVALATVTVTVSFWAAAYGFAVGGVGTPDGGAGDDATVTATAAVALGVVLVPVAFLLAAFVSRKKEAPLMVLAGMGLALAVGLPALVFGNPLGALVAGYAAGATVTLARPDRMTLRWRAAAAAGIAVLVLVGMQVAFLATAWLAPALPFATMAIIDHYTPRPPPLAAE